jgi:hypothetical protein
LARAIQVVTAVLVAITVFVIPVASMPLHCMFMVPSGGTEHPCRMMEMGSPTDGVQLSSASINHSCCQVSAAKPESLTLPQSPRGKSILSPPTVSALLVDLPAVPVMRDVLDSAVPSPGGPPQAFLCTFLI